MRFHFPDSGKDIEIDGLSSATMLMLRGNYESNYPGKPVEPDDPLEKYAGKPTNTPEAKAEIEEYAKTKQKYTKDLAEWSIKMNQARWAATKLYYCACVLESSIDKEAVLAEVRRSSPYIDLPKSITEAYQLLGIEFDPSLMERYIYLFHVCITNVGEQTLFEDALVMGTAPTQEAVQSITFRFGRAV